MEFWGREWVLTMMLDSSGIKSAFHLSIPRDSNRGTRCLEYSQMSFSSPCNNLMFRCPQVNATNPEPPQIPHNNSVQITSSTNIYSFLKILYHFPLSLSPSKPSHVLLLALSISCPLFSLIVIYTQHAQSVNSSFLLYLT